MTEFLNEKYPKLSSLLELDIEKAEREYLFWLNEQGIKTHRTHKYIIRKSHTSKNNVAIYLRTIYTSFLRLTDDREEWKKTSGMFVFYTISMGLITIKVNQVIILISQRQTKRFEKKLKNILKNGCLVKQILLGFSTKLYDHFITIFQFCILYRTYMEKFKSLKEPIWKNTSNIYMITLINRNDPTHTLKCM